MQLVQVAESAVARMDASPDIADHPTFFEITTALALLHFRRCRVDLAVLEVGLGGRLDSTNVCTPLVSVITSISLDHTRQLGNSLAEIAIEKAGIIKPGHPRCQRMCARVKHVWKLNASPSRETVPSQRWVKNLTSATIQIPTGLVIGLTRSLNRRRSNIKAIYNSSPIAVAMRSKCWALTRATTRRLRSVLSNLFVRKGGSFPMRRFPLDWPQHAVQVGLIGYPIGQPSFWTPHITSPRYRHSLMFSRHISHTNGAFLCSAQHVAKMPVA